MIHFLDLIGTLAFAIYGAYLAQQKGFDVFGIGVTALISSLGGGTVRDLLLNHLPIYFNDYWYLVMVSLGVILAIVTYKYFHKIQNVMLMVDALGLVTFALIGAQKATEANLGLLGILLLSVISAVGGGILRDLMLNRVPEIFYQDFYATPAIILGLGYFMFIGYMSQPLVMAGLLVGVYIIRLLAIYYKIQLWKPQSEV